MQYTAGFVLAIAGLAAAQSSTAAVATTTASAATSSSTAASGCGTAIDNIIQACLGSTQPQLTACAANDWDCMCTQSQNVLTCYNNCPSDPNAFGAQQQKTSYCNAAKAYGSSSYSGTASATASVSPSLSSALASVSSAVSTAVNSGFATATSASGSASDAAAAAATESASSAGKVIVPGTLAAMLGLAALL